MPVVGSVVQWRPLAHVARVHYEGDVRGLAQVYWVAVHVMADVKYLLLQDLVLYQLSYSVRCSLADLCDQVMLPLKHEFNALLTAILASQM